MTPNNFTTELRIAEPITVDLETMIENGESPTAVIFAISVFTAVLLGSLYKLVHGMVLVLRYQKNANEEESS